MPSGISWQEAVFRKKAAMKYSSRCSHLNAGSQGDPFHEGASGIGIVSTQGEEWVGGLGGSRCLECVTRGALGEEEAQNKG